MNWGGVPPPGVTQDCGRGLNHEDPKLLRPLSQRPVWLAFNPHPPSIPVDVLLPTKILFEFALASA